MAHKKNIISASIIVGLVVLFLDFIVHSTIGNPETNLYFLSKPFIAGYVAYLFFSNTKLTKRVDKFFKIKKDSFKRIFLWSTLFAFIHGLYYRIFELFTGVPFFSRVGDVVIGSFIFSGSSILMGTLAWWGIHGISFHIGIIIARRFTK